MKKLRVVQWAAGNVGRRAIIAIHNNPHLELVGCHVRGPDKAGTDAGVPVSYTHLTLPTNREV